MKTKYPIEMMDLRHQLDQKTPEKIQLFQESSSDPGNAKLFLVIVRRREIELISDGNKLIECKVIQLKILNLKNFMKKYKLKDDTMKESQSQRVYNYPIYPRDSKI